MAQADRPELSADSALSPIGGPGLERGVEGEPAEFNVWTREAGPGSLAISVEGPSKAHIDFKDRKDGSCYVSYIVEVNFPGISTRFTYKNRSGEMGALYAVIKKKKRRINLSFVGILKATDEKSKMSWIHNIDLLEEILFKNIMVAGKCGNR